MITYYPILLGVPRLVACTTVHCVRTDHFIIPYDNTLRVNQGGYHSGTSYLDFARMVVHVHDGKS
jgi:hypothetical protein